jgi:cardiolipin synthase A/B
VPGAVSFAAETVMPDTWSILTIAQVAAGLLVLALALGAAGHALIHKRDSRAAALWVGFIALVPLLGAVLYLLLGINRIKRRAGRLRGDLKRVRADHAVAPCPTEALPDRLGPDHGHLAALARAESNVLSRALLPGNRIEPLTDGDEAFPAMLDAIARAERSVALSTYIFDRDEAGRAFVDALAAAHARGVAVRVLIDATGTRYSWPSILGLLRRAGIPHARFLPTFPLWRLLSMNLRNHRKILVVDGRTGFTGGMNLRAGHWLDRRPPHPVRDLHFRIEGPVVAHLQEVFADDWFFTTREALRGEAWFPDLAACGPSLARGIADGPDEDFEKLRWTLLAALTAAQRSVRIATPYFLPDASLIAALNLAALRGVAVDILLPEWGNLPIVQWASAALWWQVLGHGGRLALSPPPFDHSKLCIVDDAWSLFGSANWDPRSLRLNFEFNVEAYDPALARRLAADFDRRRARARPVTLADADARRLPVRLRDGLARLLTPYL